mmetsp:Transcript_20126/g.50334  ORF Transcript_20126/g.50334 Transcript_20126/m.50334 type:complete len:274 (-) Transcript_20126:352-1173(-)
MTSFRESPQGQPLSSCWYPPQAWPPGQPQASCWGAPSQLEAMRLCVAKYTRSCHRCCSYPHHRRPPHAWPPWLTTGLSWRLVHSLRRQSDRYDSPSPPQRHARASPARLHQHQPGPPPHAIQAARAQTATEARRLRPSRCLHCPCLVLPRCPTASSLSPLPASSCPCPRRQQNLPFACGLDRRVSPRCTRSGGSRVGYHTSIHCTSRHRPFCGPASTRCLSASARPSSIPCTATSRRDCSLGTGRCRCRGSHSGIWCISSDPANGNRRARRGS